MAVISGRAPIGYGRIEIGSGVHKHGHAHTHAHTQAQLTTDGGILMWPVARCEVSLRVFALSAVRTVEKWKLNKWHLHDNEVL